MCFNALHQIMITADGFIKWSFHLVDMIKLTPVSWEMTPVVINFSINGGRCDSHTNRAQWQGGNYNFSKLRQPNCRGGATGNHIIRLRGKHCSLKQNNTAALSAAASQHICRLGRFHRGYALTYNNELLKINSKLFKLSEPVGISARGFTHL